MPVNVLPVSRLVSVSVALTPAAIQSQSLKNALILGSSPVIDLKTRIRDYSGIDAVAAEFGTNTPEYAAALLWFEQSPQPSSVSIGRWAKTAASGQLLGAPLSTSQQAIATWQAITSGGFSVQIDGASAEHLASLNFSAAANLNAVAAIIQTGLTGATILWDSVYKRFVITSNSTGSTSTVSFVTAPTAGVDIGAQLGLTAASNGATLSGGAPLESALAAVTLFDNYFGQKWYGLIVATETSSDDLAIAAYIEAAANFHFFGSTTQDALTLDPNDTTCLAYQLSQLKYQRTAVQYSSTTPYAAASLLGRILTTDYDGNNQVITLMYKAEPGVVPENLNLTQMNALVSKNANAFVSYNNNTAIIEPGQTTAGAPYWIDTVMIEHAVAIAIQAAAYNALYSIPTKVAQSDPGMHQIVTAVEAVCAQFVTNGSLAPGYWTAQGFGALNPNDWMPKGYYVYCDTIQRQSPANRAKRMGMPIQVALKLAGAIHSANVSVLVNN